MDIVLFCHVEPGTVRGLEIVFRPGHREELVVALRRAVEFADRYTVPMTFALTPFAAENGDTDLRGHEVGLHLHPQDALLQQVLERRVTLSSDCLTQYSEENQRTLIETAKAQFEDLQGHSPRTFVAGNWSENNATARLLPAAGFLYDGSPLPGHRSACADWSRISRLAQPYAPHAEDYQRRGTANFLYIPVYRGLWNGYLTPENIHILGASYFKAALQEALVGGAECVHMFFHSAMAMNPFFLSEFEEVVEFAQDLSGVRFVLPAALRSSTAASSKPFPPAYFGHLNWRLIKHLLGQGTLGERILSPPEPSDLSRPASPPPGRKERAD